LECILNQVDPQFETTQGFKYRLSVLLCQDGFSFLVTHAISKKALRLASYTIATADIQHGDMGGWPLNGDAYFEKLKEVDFIRQAYHRVDIAVASYKITLAPSEFFEFGNKMNIMSATHSVSADEVILTEPVFDLGPATAILMPGYIREYCEKLFPGSWLHNAPAVFVKGVLHKYSKIIARQVFINIHRGYFEIALIQGSRLLYLNAFRYTSHSDVLYYVIFVLEQLGFVPSEEKITLMGEISGSEIVCSQLKMYCASICFAELPEGIEFGDAFSGIALHQYFTLINIPECE
jgi:hypothetical protein